MIRLTTPGTIGTTAERQEWFQIGKRTTMLKFINQCCSFEHTAVLKRKQATSSIALGWPQFDTKRCFKDIVEKQ